MRRAGATLRCSARASHRSGLFCCGARALGVWASVVVARELQSAGSIVVANGVGCSVARHVGSSRTTAQTHVFCIGRQILNHCATREAQKIWTFFFFNEFIYLFIFGCIGSSLLRSGFSLSSCSKQGLLFVAVHGLLIAMASLVAELGL